jgi:hypothetical protein
MIVNGFRTSFRMCKQGIFDLMHDPVCSNQTHPRHKKIYGQVLAVFGR